MTFSITARCPRTGACGVAVSSSSPAVASRCAYVAPGVGAAASQNVTDPRLGPRLLGLLGDGLSAAEAIDRVVREEPAADIAYRQLAVVALGPAGPAGGTGPAAGPGGALGAPAVHSGDRALGTYGSVVGEHSVAAGNLLASPDVLDAMVRTAESDAQAQRPLARRLLAALEAGLAAGGEAGPVRSAGLLVAHDAPWPVVDLRIDWTEGDPVAELGALLDIWEPQQDDYVQRGLHPAGAPSYGVPGDE